MRRGGIGKRILAFMLKILPFGIFEFWTIVDYIEVYMETFAMK